MPLPTPIAPARRPRRHSNTHPAQLDSNDPIAEPDLSRLFDVRAPVVDPAQLEKLLRLQLQLQESQTSSPPASPRTPHFPPSRLPASIPESARGATPDAQAAEIRMVLDKVNARRVIHAEHGDALCNLEEEELGGFALRLERGELGLRRLSTAGGGEASQEL